MDAAPTTRIASSRCSVTKLKTTTVAKRVTIPLPTSPQLNRIIGASTSKFAACVALTRRCTCESSHTPAIPSLPSGVVMSRLYLLVVAALRAGEWAYFSGAVCRHDGCLVPVEDVATRLAPLPEGNDRAAFAHDLATSHLYRHPTSARKTRLRPYCMPTASF